MLWLKLQRWLLLGSLHLAPAAWPAATAHAATAFRWKIKEGDRFQIEITQGMKQIITQGENTVEVPNTMVMFMTWQADKVDEQGVAHLSQTIDRIKMSVKTPDGGDVSYDSAAKDEPTGVARTIAEMLKPMVGVKFTQAMDNRGRIVDVKVPAEALKGLNANPLIKQFFSSDSFRSMMRQASPVLPAEAIEKGHRWNNSTENKTPVGKMKMAATYSYEGPQATTGGDTLDKFTADIKLAFEDGTGPLGAQIKVIEQDNSGEMYFDQRAGHFTETRMQQKLTLRVTVGDTSVDQRIETNVRMTVKRAGDN